MRAVALLLALLALAPAAPPRAVLPGVEVLLTSGLDALAGRRIGLVTHAAAVDRRGRRTADLLAARARVVALLALEHGIAGQLRAGEPARAGRDARTGIPIRPLYPAITDAALDGLDLIVIDLQDAGVRPYTYPWSAVRLLRAAARRRLAVMVLDRPDPQGGHRIEGPVLDAPPSLLGEFPVPVVYGMTLGELLAMVNAEERLGVPLTVVPLRGWRRGMTWAQTGLPWVPPSPNLPDPHTARLFAALGMLEGTTVSDGVGWRPFQAVGAPWLDGERLAAALRARRLPGLRIEAAAFVPTAGRFAGQRLRGVTLTLTDAAAFRPVATALHVLDAVARQHPGRLRFAPIFDRVWGTARVREALHAGTDPDALRRRFDVEVAGFARVRARYLRYR